MARDRYRSADPHGVIARFVGSSAVARSAEGTYIAWRYSLRGGLDPARAAAIVLASGACRSLRPEDRRLRRLLERTSGFARLASNDNKATAED